MEKDYIFKSEIFENRSYEEYSDRTYLNNNDYINTMVTISLESTHFSQNIKFENRNSEELPKETYSNKKSYSFEFINLSLENNHDFQTEIIEKDKYLTIKNRTELIQTIINDLFSGLNMTEIDNNIDKKIINDNIKFIFTSTSSQKNNEDINNISMNLGECENILKREYNISNNASLYILQIISEEMGMKIPKMEYEIYYPLYNKNNLTKLDSYLCEGTKVEISIKVKINEDIDKYNASSGYYNDICYKIISESGTDISLKDRKNEYVNNNMTLCEENCELIEYNYNKEKAKCSCDIKSNIPDNYDFKFNKNDFFKSFIDIKNIANLNILECYKIVLVIKSLIKNFGFFIVSFILLLYFITLFIFWFISFKKIKKDINKIFFILNKIAGKKEEKDENDMNKASKMKTLKIKIKRKKHKQNINENNNIKKLIENKKEKNYSGQITRNENDNSINVMNKNIVELIFLNDNYYKELMEQKDFELNSLDYEDALKLDHRNYFQHYISLIKNNHPIIFSFASFKDYNSRIIKMFLFFFSFSLDFTINAFFFNDDTMHKIYEDKGKYNFLYQIPQILYSAIIGRFIDALIKNLALSQDNIVELKKEKKSIDKNYLEKLIRILKIKFICFFISCFIILLFFWYYIICFCGIYENTQMHLISDSMISLSISLLLPFLLYLIPGIFRISGLRNEKPYLYKFSSFLENYLD